MNASASSRRQPPAAAANPGPDGEPRGKLALFGWLRGTVVETGDLTEPADPEWAERVDHERPPAA
jgi:hypothetical protein